jgi:myo-inositol catabolism protein IolC
VPIGPDARLLALGIGPRGADERPSEVVDAGALFEAATRAADATGLGRTEVAVVVDGPRDTDLVADARRRGFAVVVAAEDAGADPVALAGGGDFARATREVDPLITSVRVAWHPDDHPDRKKEQALALTRLAAWLHETDRQLLVEVVVGPAPADPNAPAADVDPNAPDDRAALVLDAVREIRDLGTEADLWGIEGPVGPQQLEALSGLARDAGRDQVTIVELHRGAGRLDAVGAVRAVVLDPAAWSADGTDVDAVTATLTRVAGRLAGPT